ncbi:MAG: hypothetical protein WC121_14240 [Candidatus Kapaibacterium sp.]
MTKELLLAGEWFSYQSENGEDLVEVVYSSSFLSSKTNTFKVLLNGKIICSNARYSDFKRNFDLLLKKYKLKETEEV